MWRNKKPTVSPEDSTHLHALAVVEQHVAQLFGHHVQVSLLAFVGSGQNVEFGEVGRHIVEGSEDGGRERL